MRRYGNVKGWKYGTDQPEAGVRGNKRRCPLCRCWKDKKEFVGADGMPRRFCRNCKKGRTR